MGDLMNEARSQHDDPIAWGILGPQLRDRFDGSVRHLEFRSTQVTTDGTASGCYIIRFMRLLGTRFPAPGDHRPSIVEVDLMAPGVRSWGRSYTGVRGDMRLDTVKTERGNLIEERSGILAIVLAPEIRENSVVLRSSRFEIAIGPVRIPIPQWLSPGRLTVEHRHEEDGRFVFDMRLTNRRLGDIFIHRGLYEDVRHGKP